VVAASPLTTELIEALRLAARSPFKSPELPDLSLLATCK
jgi:hypothetical protein